MAESMVDEFGITKIYPTNTHPNRAKPWLLQKGDWLKRRYNGVGDWNDCPISTDSNGDVIINFNTSGRKGRFPVLALLMPITATDQRNLRKRGYMGTRNDWKNVEMTLYWKVEEVADGIPTMAFCARGGPHHSNFPLFSAPCEGTCYITKLAVEGSAAVTKELGHPQYTGDIFSETNVDNLMHRWVGMKGIFYNMSNTDPKIELWLDDNNNNDWKLVLTVQDSGGWFLREGIDNDCGGARDERITWGGPGVIFKLADIRRVDMKWASVREIIPPDGYSLRNLLNAKGISFPINIREVAEDFGLTVPFSVSDLIQRELY